MLLPVTLVDWEGSEAPAPRRLTFLRQQPNTMDKFDEIAANLRHASKVAEAFAPEFTEVEQLGHSVWVICTDPSLFREHRITRSGASYTVIATPGLPYPSAPSALCYS